MKRIVAKKLDLSRESLEDFVAQVRPLRIVDYYEEQLKELFLIRNPRFKFQPDYKKELDQFTHEQTQEQPIQKCGNWFYFDWRGVLVHVLPVEMHLEIRTARNKNLISADEQNRLYQSTIAVTGLSVGSHGALTMALSGIGAKFKFSDFDTISASNLNRISSGLSQLGVLKADWVAQTILELDPYAEIYVYDQGINKENIKEFINGSSDTPPVDLLVEELDSLAIKIMLREEAKLKRIPVIMVTDTENPVVDIERYDIDPNLPIFNGLLEDTESFKNFDPKQMVKMVTKIIGAENFSSREQQSMSEVGKSLYSWPQLGAQAALSGGIIAYLVKKILLGYKIESGKQTLSLDAVFDAGYNSSEAAQGRAEKTAQFKNDLGL